MATKRLAAIDRVMIGNRDQGHSLTLQFVVYRVRRTIRFAAEILQHREGAIAGVDRMNVQVAEHNCSLKSQC